MLFSSTGLFMDWKSKTVIGMLSLSTAVHDNIGINLQSSILNDLKLKTRNGTHFNNRGYSL